tara:strand:- start:296 stop:940 length:645 start_codon:yes stop_codon:yes gene_type:complete
MEKLKGNYIGIPRHLKYLNDKKIVYVRHPISDVPTLSTSDYDYYEEGTYQCYHLFRSEAKITTYKSLKWHLLVLWYLNPDMYKDEFVKLAKTIAEYTNGFISFELPESLLLKIINSIYALDLESPPKNKSRKIIFKQSCGLNLSQKMKIVGKLIGRSSRIDEEIIYQCMLDINDMNERITINKLALSLKCTPRTIHRNMGYELKKEKELLNKNL